MLTRLWLHCRLQRELEQAQRNAAQPKEATAAVARSLDAAGVARFSNVVDWPRQLVSSCPRQANGDDCGAFALVAAQQLAPGIR